MAFVTVAGRLLASHFQAGGEVPLTGQIFFTPTMEKVPTGQGVHLPAPTSVELDGDGRFEVELLSAGFSWEVAFSLRHAGAFVPAGCFNFLPTPGVDRINFADIVPLTDPVTSQPMLRGEDGVGVEAITTEGGELIFTLTDGAETRIPVPQGIPGTGVDTITLQGGELVFTLSDGSETRLPAPGVDAPKPTLAVGDVQTLPAGATATAEVTGESPDFVLSMGLPAGANGTTPTITAGTVSTLPAGASATAELTPTTGGYALNLGLPAGAPGANGKDAPTPTLAVGTVSTGTASASITGTAPNYTLNLTLPPGSKGEPGNQTAYLVTGEGQPEGRVVASVGTTYIDTLATAGAVRWIKTSGTGNVGWKVEYGDTGWRNITGLVSPLPSSWSWGVSPGGVYIKRSSQTVDVAIRGLNATTVTNNTTLLTLPQGFRVPKLITDQSSIPLMDDAGREFTGKVTFWDGSLIQVKMPLKPSRLNVVFSLPASDNWPSTLPGTPA